MSLSTFSLKLLLLFLPGLISFIITDNFSNHRATKTIHWFIYPMLFGFLAYAILTVISAILGNAIGFWQYLISPDPEINYHEIVYAVFIGVVLGIMATWSMNHAIPFRVASFFHITQRIGYPDTLSYMLSLYAAKYLTVTDWEKGIRIVGELVAASEPTDERDELVLQQCKVYNLQSGELLYSIDVFYLSQTFTKVTIEISSDESKEVEDDDVLDSQSK